MGLSDAQPLRDDLPSIEQLIAAADELGGVELEIEPDAPASAADLRSAPRS